MVRKKPEGWRNKKPDDPHRHALSAKGIPNAPYNAKQAIQHRNSRIVEEVNEGVDKKDIADRYNLSIGRVNEILKAWEIYRKRSDARDVSPEPTPAKPKHLETADITKEGKLMLSFPEEELRPKEGMAVKAFQRLLNAMFGKDAPKDAYLTASKDGVEMRTWESPHGAFMRYSAFEGIMMSYYDYDKKKTVRRMQKVKDGKIDLAKVMQKFDELKRLRKESEGYEERKRARRETRETKIKQLRSELDLPYRIDYVSPYEDDKFKITLSDLTEEKLRDLKRLDFLRGK